MEGRFLQGTKVSVVGSNDTRSKRAVQQPRMRPDESCLGHKDCSVVRHLYVSSDVNTSIIPARGPLLLGSDSRE